jgi:hypothetical protein
MNIYGGTPLICDRCGQEILPGSKVALVNMEDEPPRIIADGDALIAHEVCPEITLEVHDSALDNETTDPA